MNRAPFQVLVFPFFIDRSNNQRIEYALFKRSDMDCWQGIAGGGNENELPLEAAKREAFEESGIEKNHNFIHLDSISSVPAHFFKASSLWGPDVYVVKEHSFGVRVDNKDIKLSDEHKECKWATYEEAVELLKWDSNKTALWELDQRIKRGKV